MSTFSDSWRSSGLALTGLRRRWRVSGRPLRPLAWIGLVATAMLLLWPLWAVGPFAQQDIDATATREIRRALNSQGQGWAGLAVSGQQALLSGTPPSVHAAQAAVAAARAATCPSDFGQLTCAVRVTTTFTPTSPSATPDPVLPAATSVPASAPPTRAAAECDAALSATLAGSSIEFAVDNAQLDTRSAAALDALAAVADTCIGTLRIDGHSDSLGETDVNRALSLERAQAVRAALVTRGVAANRLIARGQGANRPVADNDTEVGRAANRRIEVQVVGDRP